MTGVTLAAASPPRQPGSSSIIGSAERGSGIGSPPVSERWVTRVIGADRSQALSRTRLYALARFALSRPERQTPREDCPHPEWWSATEDESTEREVTALVAGFVRALQPEYVIETGSAFGQTTRAIGKALRRNGHGRLDSIEIDPVHVRQTRLVTYRLPVTVHETSSMDFTPAERLDFVWFDSMGTLRVPEFRRFRPWMHPGTVVGFHDTAIFAAEIGEPVRALEREGLIRALHLPTPRGVVFAQPT